MSRRLRFSAWTWVLAALAFGLTLVMMGMGVTP